MVGSSSRPGTLCKATGAGRVVRGQCPRFGRGGQAAEIVGKVMDSDGNIVAAGDAEGNVVLTDEEGNVLAADEKGNTIVEAAVGSGAVLGSNGNIKGLRY